MNDPLTEDQADSLRHTLKPSQLTQSCVSRLRGQLDASLASADQGLFMHLPVLSMQHVPLADQVVLQSVLEEKGGVEGIIAGTTRARSDGSRYHSGVILHCHPELFLDYSWKFQELLGLLLSQRIYSVRFEPDVKPLADLPTYGLILYDEHKKPGAEVVNAVSRVSYKPMDTDWDGMKRMADLIDSNHVAYECWLPHWPRWQLASVRKAADMVADGYHIRLAADPNGLPKEEMEALALAIDTAAAPWEYELGRGNWLPRPWAVTASRIVALGAAVRVSQDVRADWETMYALAEVIDRHGLQFQSWFSHLGWCRVSGRDGKVPLAVQYLDSKHPVRPLHGALTKFNVLPGLKVINPDNVPADKLVEGFKYRAWTEADQQDFELNQELPEGLEVWLPQNQCFSMSKQMAFGPATYRVAINRPFPAVP